MELAVEKKKRGLENWIALRQFTAVMTILQGTRTYFKFFMEVIDLGYPAVPCYRGRL